MGNEIVFFEWINCEIETTLYRRFYIEFQWRSECIFTTYHQFFSYGIKIHSKFWVDLANITVKSVLFFVYLLQSKKEKKLRSSRLIVNCLGSVSSSGVVSCFLFSVIGNRVFLLIAKAKLHIILSKKQLRVCL